jgi:hypothetical protein
VRLVVEVDRVIVDQIPEQVAAGRDDDADTALGR